MNYYIQGDAAKAQQIKAAFEAKAIYSNLNFANENYLYYQCDGKVAFCFIGGGLARIIKTHPDYKELELPKPHYDIANFKPFDKVLVRDNDKYIWSVELFSFYRNKHSYPFRCVGNAYSQCIPYDGNEALLGTTDMCPQEYINW